MTRTRPGRLYRLLRDAPRSMFEAKIGTLTLSDGDIASITSTYGSGSVDGTQSGLCEITVPGVVTPDHAGKGMSVSMTAAMADWIRSRTGAWASVVRDRYTGRSAQLDVQDTGRSTTQTTVQGNHWLALANSSSHTISATKGTYINNVVRALLLRSQTDYTLLTFGPFDRIWENMPDIRWSDKGNTLVDDYGLLLAPHRDGTAHLTNLPARYADALAQVGVVPTLLRSQVLAPTTWEQPNLANDVIYRVLRYDETGTYRESDVFTEDALLGDASTTEVDWTWAIGDTQHWYMAAKARAYRTGARTVRLSKVRVDLLHLLTSPREHDRNVAGHLLSLDVGSVVTLSGDWRGLVSGLYVVTELKERITGEAWEIELSITSSLHVFAEYSPVIPADVWDSANYSWDDEIPSRTWNG